MTDTQKSTDKKKTGQGKSADTDLSIAMHQLSVLESLGLCVELPTVIAKSLADALAVTSIMRETVGNARVFIIDDTRPLAILNKKTEVENEKKK